MSVRSIKKAPGQWKIRIVTTDPRTGKRKEIKRVVAAASKFEALRQEDEIKRVLLDGAKARLTVKDYCEGWFIRKRDGELSRDGQPIAKATLLEYAASLERFLAALGDVHMDELTPLMIKDWLSKEAQRPGRHGAPSLSGHTLRRMLAPVKQMTKDAQVDLRLPVWPCERVRNPRPCKEYEDDENALTPNDLALLWDSMQATEPTHFPLFAMMAMTGLRFCHAHALEWNDIDLERGTYQVRRSRYRKEAHKPSKRKRGASGALIPELVDVLRVHREQLLRDQNPGLARGLVFPTSIGTHYDHRTLSKPIARAAKRAGLLDRFTPHGLRRTFNTLALKIAPAELVRKMLGHNSAGMTQRYLSADMDAKREVAVGVLQLVRAGLPADDER